ncbi:MAG: DUF2399 domain-containing protein [Treponema sp.]|jgi:hypothetical protein|nr:DUF2399 domain-containing protein [Treponema sp.]
MTAWEKRIINRFIDRYAAALSRREGAEGARLSLRLRSRSVFPEFDAASPDEKESYLEAAEALERKKLLKLSWEKRGKGERLNTLLCEDMGKLFKASGRMEPVARAETIRMLFKARLPAAGNSPLPKKALPSEHNSGREKAEALLGYLAENFSARGLWKDIDMEAAGDFASLLAVFFDPLTFKSMTTRAASILLYSDSKRLETVMDLFHPILSLAERQGVPLPDFSFLERSFPETLLSGRISLEYKNGEAPLVNAAGSILGFPLASVREMQCVRALFPQGEPRVLSIENKEVFYALSGGLREGVGEIARYDCFLYTGGYPNQAAAALLRLMASSGFSFFHAGDLDPDGILILQHVMDIAGRPVSPLRMDASSFDRYLPWARPLADTVLRQVPRIRDDTRALPGLAELIRRIEETGRGVEQEIIDYRS